MAKQDLAEKAQGAITEFSSATKQLLKGSGAQEVSEIKKPTSFQRGREAPLIWKGNSSIGNLDSKD